jgi:thiol-disulfide isomerase/thioredoxin
MKNKLSRIALYLGIAGIALLAGYFARIWFAPLEPQKDAAQVLLASTLEDTGGAPQSIAQWKGKVLVVNFWATWCPPCLKEIPEFIALQNRYGAKGVQFVGIAIDQKDRVIAYMAQVGMNYPVLMAEKEGITLARDAGNRLGGLPFTVIIDKQGRTARVELGVLNEQKLVPVLDGLL